MKKGDRYTESFLVNETIYQGFLQTFRDHNPLHTDEAFAREKGFRSAVMHGNILNGFLSFFVGECLPQKNVVIHSQEIRYGRPVYLNDRLQLTATVNEVFESVGAVEIGFVFENADGLRVAKGKLQIGILP